MPARSCATRRSSGPSCSATTRSRASPSAPMPTASASPSRTTASAWAATRWPRRWAPSRAPARAPSWSGSRPPRTATARVHRPVRHRLLFGVHGRRPRRRDHAPGRQRRGLAVVVRRQGHVRSAPAAGADAPKRGTRVVLHLMDDAKSYTERYTLERMVKAQSGHVPVPISIVEKPGAEPKELTDGTALWTKPKAEIKPEEYNDFYRSVAGQFDEPAMTVHYRAEGRQEYHALAFVPGSRPFDLFDQDRNGRVKLYVQRVFITDEAELLPRYLRFVRGIVDSADLPLNVSREMIQESPLLAADQEGRHRPHPRRPGKARRERCRGLRQDMGKLRHRAQGRHLRGFRAARRSC